MRLQHLIADAGRHVPFYREFWRQHGIDPARAAQRKLQDLPIVSKKDLLGHAIATRVDERTATPGLRIESTSGSSGQPFSMYLDRAIHFRRQWRFLMALAACGYRPGQKLMLVAGRNPSSIMRLGRWFYTDLEAGEESLAAEYRRIGPSVLYGPVSSLLVLADTLISQRATSPKPRVVICTAEQLLAPQRALLSVAFGPRIADFYGLTELGLVAWRPPAARSYRVATSDLLLEFLPTGRDDGAERLLVTDLRNKVCPMIRFDTGDLVRRQPGSHGLEIVGFAGREIDCLLLRGGRKVSPYRATLRLEEIGGIEQYEVIQRRDLSVDVYLWGRLQDPATAIASAQSSISTLLGGELAVRAHYAPAPRERGPEKFRPVRCEAGS